MAIHEAASRPRQVTEGRSGLWVPIAEIIGTLTPKETFLMFFRDLWDANGYKAEPKSFSFHPPSTFPEGFNRELVLPAVDGKPLMVLRGNLTPKDRRDVEAEAEKQPAELGRWSPVTSGTEQHGIYVPPASLGQFEPLLTVTHYHQYGGSERNFVEPNTRVKRRGEEIREENFIPPSYEHNSAEENLEFRRIDFLRYMGTLMREAIDLLS